MTKFFATAAALATIIIGGDALALPAVQSNHHLEHQASTGRLGSNRRSSIEVHSFSYGVQTPLDNATGHLTGKRQHKPIFFTGKRQHKPIVFTGRRLHSDRDAASGLPTGKRMH